MLSMRRAAVAANTEGKAIKACNISAAVVKEYNGESVYEKKKMGVDVKTMRSSIILGIM